MKIERDHLFTCQPSSEKEMRNLSIYEIIRQKGLVSKPEISKTTGINIVSISNYINSYLAKRLVLEKEAGASSGGRRPELVELNTEDGYVLGILLGEREAQAIVTDLSLKIRDRFTAPVATPKARDVQEAVLTVTERAVERWHKAPANLKAVGLVAPDRQYVDIAAALTERFGIEAFLSGYAFAAGSGERALNPSASVATVLYLYTEAGEGVVMRGERAFGFTESGMNGTLKNGVAADEDLADAVRYLGPWSADLGLVPSARRQVEKGVGTKIVELAGGSIDGITAATVFAAAHAGDRVASDIITNIGINLGLRASYLVNLFRPSAVVIGGGIEEAGEAVLAPIRDMVKRFAVRKVSRTVKVVPGALGHDAALLGAAALAVRESFIQA